MRSRRKATTAAPVFAAATVAYAVNCALGTAVRLKIVDTSRFRWLHHALYIATCTAVAAAVSGAAWGRPRTASRRAALTLAPAAIPLAALAFVGTNGGRHPLVALAAAPFITAGAISSRRPPDRK